MKVFKKQPFKIDEREFVTMAAHDKEPNSVRVWVETKDGKRVVLTYPDGSTVTKCYTVTLEVLEMMEARQDLPQIEESHVVARLMATAEADVRDDAKAGLS